MALAATAGRARRQRFCVCFFARSAFVAKRVLRRTERSLAGLRTSLPTTKTTPRRAALVVCRASPPQASVTLGPKSAVVRPRSGPNSCLRAASDTRRGAPATGPSPPREIRLGQPNT